MNRTKLTLAVLAGLSALVLACGGGADSEADGGAEAAGGGDKPVTAKIGKPARDGKFEFTVTKVDNSGKVQVGDQYGGDKAQGVYVFVHVSVKNIGDEPQMFAGEDQKLFSADGKEFSADTEAAIWLKDSESLWEEINPGNEVKGVVVFDVPKGTKLAKLVLHDSAFSGGVEVAVK